MSRQYPRITQGLGKLDPEMWGRLMDSLEFTEKVGPKLQLQYVPRRVPARRGESNQVKMFRTTDIVQIGVNKWEYGWEQVVLSGTVFNRSSTTGTHLDPGFDRALNTEEATNGSDVTGFGVPVSGGLATLTPEPIAIGSIVPGIFMVDQANSELQRPVLMPATNALQVACTLP